MVQGIFLAYKRVIEEGATEGNMRHLWFHYIPPKSPHRKEVKCLVTNFEFEPSDWGCLPLRDEFTIRFWLEDTDTMSSV